MNKFNNRPGAISDAIQKIPDVFFENGAMVVLAALIFELPVKMICIIIMNNWKSEYIYVAVQSYIVFLGLILISIFLAKRVLEKGFSFISNIVRKNIFLIPLAAFLICGFFSSVLADDPYLALYSNLHRMEGYITYLYYVIVLFTAAMILDVRKKRFMLNVFAFSSALICFPSVLKKYEYVADFFGLKGNIIYISNVNYKSVFSYFNHYGYFLAMAVLCCAALIFTDRRRSGLLLHSVLMIINVWSLLINDTFGSYVGAAAAIVFITCLFVFRSLLKHERPKVGLLIKVAIPAVIFFTMSIVPFNSTNSIGSQVKQLTTDVSNVAENKADADKAGTGRWILWKTTAGYIADRPLFGYGCDGVIERFADDGFIQDRPANEYLQYAVFFGIPGMIFYVLTLLGILTACLRKLSRSKPITLAIGGCAIAYAISACFGNTMYNTTIYFYMFLGLLIRGMHEENNTEDIKSI